MKAEIIDLARGSSPTLSKTDGSTATTTMLGLSVRRLNVMRIGYAVMGVGIAVRNWPLLINRSEPWPLYEGVTKYILVAMGCWHCWGFVTQNTVSFGVVFATDRLREKLDERYGPGVVQVESALVPVD